MSLVLSGGVAADPPGISEISARARLLWRGPLRAALLYLALAGGLVASIFIALALLPESGQDHARVEPEPLPKSPWLEIVRPFQLYELAAADFGREPSSFEARRHRDGGGRIDTLTWGSLGSDERPYLRVAFHRVGRERVEDGSFFVQMVRQAAGFGVAVTRGGVSDVLKTRFGAFEVADVALETGKATSECLGFRFASSQPALADFGFRLRNRGAPSRPAPARLHHRPARPGVVRRGQGARQFFRGGRKRPRSALPAEPQSTAERSGELDGSGFAGAFARGRRQAANAPATQALTLSSRICESRCATLHGGARYRISPIGPDGGIDALP